MRARALDLQRRTREALIAEQRLDQPGWSAAELEPWADAKLRFNPTVINVFDPAFSASVDWSAVPRRITCPALLITGDPAHGAIVSAEDAAALRALVPQLVVAHVPAAGHSIRRDQIAAYLDVVRSFLAGQRLTLAS